MKKLNCASLGSEAGREELVDATAEPVRAPLPTVINVGWLFGDTDGQSERNPKLCHRKNRDWFDSNLESIQALLLNKHRALIAYLADCTSIPLQHQWKLARSAAKWALCCMEGQWWQKISEQIQGYAEV